MVKRLRVTLPDIEYALLKKDADNKGIIVSTLIRIILCDFANSVLSIKRINESEIIRSVLKMMAIDAIDNGSLTCPTCNHVLTMDDLRNRECPRCEQPLVEEIL